MPVSPPTIPKLRFSEPKRNLPGRRGVATEEDRFTLAFARAYLARAAAIHRGSPRSRIVCAREIPVNGYGIADLVAVAWAPLSGETFPDMTAFSNVAKPTTRAFEVKLSDWRKGMSQAGRYRYFAHQSILVIPEDLYASGTVKTDTFRAIGTGLWTFNPDTGTIRPVHTPRPRRPKCFRHHLDALEKVHRATTRSLPIV